MPRLALTGLLAFALATPAMAGSALKAKNPRLDLRAFPRIAFSPVNVLLTAELVGGEDVEEYYCPAVEWDWDDGSKSFHEADCAPFEDGAALDRRFTAEHAYRGAGTYNVRVTLRRVNRSVAVANVTITVR